MLRCQVGAWNATTASNKVRAAARTRQAIGYTIHRNIGGDIPQVSPNRILGEVGGFGATRTGGVLPSGKPLHTSSSAAQKLDPCINNYEWYVLKSISGGLLLLRRDGGLPVSRASRRPGV